MVCRPRLSLCAEREGLALPVLLHFACQSFAPQLTGPFPTACALLRKPRRGAKFRPMVYLRGGSARCRLYSTELFASCLQIAQRVTRQARLLSECFNHAHSRWAHRQSSGGGCISSRA